MATSEARFEQSRRVGCRATRRMPTVTGSRAAVKGWTAAQRSSVRSTAHERSPASLVPRITSNATITRNVMVKCSWKHKKRKPYDEGHGCESCLSHRSTSMKSFRRGVASVQAVHWVCQPDASSQGIQNTHSDFLSHVGCNELLRNEESRASISP